MKARLLKKIRKRYSIIRYDNIGSNPTDRQKRAEKEFGLPFYALNDTNLKRSIAYTSYFGILEDARKKLWRWILSDYGEKYRHKDAVTEKVWYKK